MGLFGTLTSIFTDTLQGQANSASGQGVALLGATKVPEIEAMKLKLQEYVQQGVLTPEMAETVLQEQTAMAGVSTDPRLKEAQLRSLASLQEVADQGGLTTADKGRLMDIQSDENAQERGQRRSILQNAQQRGIGGSGLELAAQLANQQGSATRASRRGYDVAANAEARALQAMMQTGQLGGQIRGQEFSEQSRIAQAKDAINRFNTANQNITHQANIDAQNAAQRTNLGVKQTIADQNVGQSNYQQQYNKQLQQQKFDNEMQKRKAQANALAGQASNFQQSADRTARVAGGVVSAAGDLIGMGKKKKEDDYAWGDG